jgi:fructose-1,6-bisphosphatase/inositol monophosphatase family enzyme
MSSLERRVASETARSAGQLLRDERLRPRRIAYKGAPTNLVTEMDAGAEELIVGRLAAAFPDDAILAEERGARARRFDGYWELSLGPWDIAAGGLLVEEAGGRVTNLGGGPLDLDAPTVVASNGKIHDAMLAVLEKIRG